MEVLLVAAKKEKIADYTGVISQAGRTPVVVDVDAFALQNAYEMNYGLDPTLGGRAAERGRERDQHQHPERRTVALHARHLGRRQRVHRSGAERAEPDVGERRAAEERATRSTARRSTRRKPVLHAVTENVLLEIQKTFDFFKATAASDRIDRIYLSGGASRVDGFAAALEERFGSPVEAVQSVHQDVVRRRTSSASPILKSLVPTAAVAVGLALRKPGDR